MKIKTSVLSVLACLLMGSLQSQSVIWTRKSNTNGALATYGVAFSADGAKVLSGSECHPANIRKFDAATGNLEWSYNVGNTFMCIQGVNFSSNGSLIASVEEFGNILIFNNTGSTPSIIDTIDTGTSYAFSADFAPSNDRIVIGASGGKMNIYNLPGGALFKSVSAHSGFVFSVAFSPDGTMMASGGADNKAKIWNADGTLKFTLNGHSNDVSSVSFSPDNAYLVTGGLDGNVKIWSTADGSLVRSINAHTNEVKQVDVSPDGARIVSASSDASCKIWDFQTGEALSTFGTPNGGLVWSANWSPDGDKIVTGTAGGDVILWDVSGVSAVAEHDWSVGIGVFPNPANDLVSFDLPAGLRLLELTISGLSGALVRRLDPGRPTFSVADLPKGVYCLQFKTGRGVCVKKLMVR